MSFGAIFEGIELISTIVMFQGQIEIQILKSKVNNLVSQHKEEFKAISQINKLLNSMIIKQPILAANLSKMNDLLIKTWQVIAKDFQQKVNIAQQLTNTYKDVDTSKYTFGVKDGLFLSFSGVMAAQQLHGFLQDKKTANPSTPEKSIQELKGSMMKQKIVIEKIKLKEGQTIDLNEGQMQLSSEFKEPKGQIQGTVEIEASGNLQAAIQAPEKSSIWSKFKTFGSKAGKLLMKGLRVLGVLGVMFGIYQQGVVISQLLKQIKQMDEKYGSGGKFHTSQIQIISLLIACGQLFSNLAYASYACLQSISNSYILMALTYKDFTSQFIEKSESVRPDSYGVSIKFCEDSNKLYKDLSKINVSNQSSNQDMRDALNKSKELLQKYVKIYNPSNLFSNLAEVLGKFTIQEGIFLTNKHIQQTNLTDFKQQLLMYFSNRDAANKENPKRIKENDKNVVLGIANSYFRLRSTINNTIKATILLNYNQFKKIDEVELSTIGDIVFSFTNTIYSESQLGDTLFGRKLSTYKFSKTFTQTAEQDEALPHIIPLPFQSPMQKQKVIHQMMKKVDMVIKQSNDPELNIYDSRQYEMSDKIPCIQVRQIENAVVINEKMTRKLEFIQTLLVKATRSRNIMDLVYISFEDNGQKWIGKILDIKK